MTTVQMKDVFWTSDHMTGIRSLVEQLEQGHEEGLASLKFFEEYANIVDLEAQMFGQLAQTQKKFIDSKYPKEETETALVKRFTATLGDDVKLSSVESVMKEQARYATETNMTQQRLHSKVNSDLVLRLKDFLDDYADFSADVKRKLQNQYNVYVRSVQNSNTLERRMAGKVRTLAELGSKQPMKDESLTENTPVHYETPSKSKSLPTPETPIIVTSEAGSPEVIKDAVSSEEEDDSFQFPLYLGSEKIDSVEDLKEILSAMISAIPVKRRMIPIPGVNNEYFTSEAFSDWVKQSFHKEDTRRKVEKFGQDMINLGLMRNWNKVLANHTFVSDGGYYEFSDLARFTAKFTPDKPQHNQAPSPRKSASSTPKKSNRSSLTPTADIWSSLKSTFGAATDAESLKKEIKDLNLKYIQSINTANQDRSKLEALIQDCCEKASKFESNRIQILLQTNKHFSETILSDHQTRASNLTKSLETMHINGESVNLELMKRTVRANSGWYWPKSEAKYIDHQGGAARVLDCDLVNQMTDPKDEDMKSKSVPVFVKAMISGLGSVTDVGDLWCKDIDIPRANEVRRFVVEWVGTHEEEGSEHIKVQRLVSVLLQSQSPSDLIDFFKLWLLELPDSVIPFTSYDALLKAYALEEPKENVINILGFIPRQNLSSLLYICEHIAAACKDTKGLIQSHKVPFYHLILRPSPRRLHAAIEDAIPLEGLVNDLLNTGFEEELHKKLVALEEYHEQRQKRVRESIIRLKENRESMTPTASPPPKADTNLTADGLRVFKTKSPLPTPVTSPRMNKPVTPNSLAPASVVSPAVKRPSQNLSKRNSLLAHES